MPTTHSSAWTRPSLALVALVLAGCASAPPYEDATGPDTAKLRLKMEAPFAVNMYLAAFDPQACKIQTAFSWLTGGVEAIYRKRVPMLGSGPAGEGRLEFIVPAGRPLAAYPVMSFPRQVDPALFSQRDFLQQALNEMDAGPCRAPAFTPEAGREYEISIRTMPGMCRTRIYQLSQGDSGIVRQDITRKLGLEVVRDGDQKPVCRAMRDDAVNR